MADITNPEAVRVANEKIRPLADSFAQLYFFTKQLQLQFIAQNWGALFPDTADPIIDGSAADGRNPIVSSDVRRMFDIATAYINFMEANTNERLNQTLVPAVNPER